MAARGMLGCARVYVSPTVYWLAYWLAAFSSCAFPSDSQSNVVLNTGRVAMRERHCASTPPLLDASVPTSVAVNVVLACCCPRGLERTRDPQGLFTKLALNICKENTQEFDFQPVRFERTLPALGTYAPVATTICLQIKTRAHDCYP